MSGSYAQPTVITYNLGNHDFGAGADALAVKAPRGFTRGRIIDVGVHVKETFTADTTPAYVRVGTTGDADAYVQLNMGTAADTDCWNTQDDTDAIINDDVTDTQLEVALVAPTGGTPAGIGEVYLVIGWYA